MPDARQYMLWAFKLRGCIDCGWKPETRDDLKLLHCDHRDPKTKTYVGRANLLPGGGGLNEGGSGRRTLAEMLDELWKCDPVCRTCHMKRGRDRRRPGEVPLPLLEWLHVPIPTGFGVGTQDQLWMEQED